MKVTMSLAVLALLGEASATKISEKEKQQDFLDENVEDGELEDTMLLQLETTHKHRISKRSQPINHEAIMLNGGRTRDVQDMIGDLDKSQDYTILDEQISYTPSYSNQNKMYNLNQKALKEEDSIKVPKMKYGYNMSQYDLADKFGDVPNVSDDKQQRNAYAVADRGAADLNTFKDSTQNANGAGRILAQQKSEYNLPENAQNLPNVDNDHQQRDVISTGHKYDPQSKTHFEDHAMQPGNSGRYPVMFSQQQYVLPENAQNLPNVDNDHQQRDVISTGHKYDPQSKTHFQDHAMQPGNGKYPVMFSQQKTGYVLPENAQNLPNVDNDHQQRDVVSTGHKYDPQSKTHFEDQAMQPGNGKYPIMFNEKENKKTHKHKHHHKHHHKKVQNEEKVQVKVESKKDEAPLEKVSVPKPVSVKETPVAPVQQKVTEVTKPQEKKKEEPKKLVQQPTPPVSAPILKKEEATAKPKEEKKAEIVKAPVAPVVAAKVAPVTAAKAEPVKVAAKAEPVKVEKKEEPKKTEAPKQVLAYTKPIVVPKKAVEVPKPQIAAEVPKPQKVEKKIKKIDDEFVPENVSTKQALKNVLSELEDDGDNLIDSFIGSAKGQEVEQVASNIDSAPSFINKDVDQ